MGNLHDCTFKVNQYILSEMFKNFFEKFIGQIFHSVLYIA